MNFMEKAGVWLFVVVLLIGSVVASWGDIGTGDGDDVVVPDDPVVSDSSADSDSGDDSSDSDGADSAVTPPDVDETTSSEFFYTRNFYIALGVAGVGILILVLFLYLFFRSPRNRWKS